MLLVALTLLLQAAPPAGAEIDDEGTITVTARRISDLAADVAACAAAPCPTRRDVAVSVAYASALFDEGRYRDATKVVNAAIARVKGSAAAEPVAVSQLYSAQAKLYRHYGDFDITRRAAFASYTVLRDNLGPNAQHSLVAAYRLGQWQVRANRFVEAEAQFAQAARQAAKAGYGWLADACDLHRAQLLERRSEPVAAFALLDAVAARDHGPDDDGDMQRAALATAVRMATDRRDHKRADAYAAKLAAKGAGDDPLLLSQQPLPRPRQDVVGWRWADVGYWIRPDGSVEDVEILRGSERRGWAEPVLRHIESRRYAPMRGSVGHYQVERYTLTADLVSVPGMPKIRRTHDPRFEMSPMPAKRPEPAQAEPT